MAGDTLEAKESGPGKEESLAVGGTAKEDPEPAANTPESPPEPTADSSPLEPSGDLADPEEATTPEQEAAQKIQERLEELLWAYQAALDEVEEHPAVVWVPWGRKRLGRHIKVPYLRWSLTYFVTYHINKSPDLPATALAGVRALPDSFDPGLLVIEEH